MTDIGDREIIRVRAGSHVNGLATEDSDVDLMSVYLEPLEATLGLQSCPKTVVSRDVPEGHRSGPGDVDLTVYRLHHYMALATQGNPNLLTVLYAPPSDVLSITAAGHGLRALAPHIVSQRGVRHHLGYLVGQHDRMRGIGTKQNRVPNRPELVDRFGYDVKYAAHAVRLGYQGLQLAATGRIVFPMPPQEREIVMSIRRGEWTQHHVHSWIEHLKRALKFVIETPELDVLRAEPDWDEINAWMVYVATNQDTALWRVK